MRSCHIYTLQGFQVTSNQFKFVTTMTLNSLNSTQDCSDWYEPYSEYHQLSSPKVLIMVLSFITMILTIAMLLDIIWYEHYGADSK